MSYLRSRGGSSLARERRAKVLAPAAAKRKRSGQPSSNLDEGATRKLAAVGTGYSGTSLDKVDVRRARRAPLGRRARLVRPVPLVNFREAAEIHTPPDPHMAFDIWFSQDLGIALIRPPSARALSATHSHERRAPRTRE